MVRPVSHLRAWIRHHRRTRPGVRTWQHGRWTVENYPAVAWRLWLRWYATGPGHGFLALEVGTRTEPWWAITVDLRPPPWLFRLLNRLGPG